VPVPKRRGKSLHKNYRLKLKEINIASVSASPVSTCHHKLGRSCSTNHLRHFMAGSESASSAQAAVPPPSRVTDKNAQGLPHGQAHGFASRQHPEGKTQMGQAPRPGLQKPANKTTSKRLSIFH